MLDVIFDRATIPLSGITPRPVGKEIFIGADCDRGRLTLGAQFEATLIARASKAVPGALESGTHRTDGVSHRHDAVGLVIGKPGHRRNEWKRNHLANENHPPRISPPTLRRT